jgi:hypothetical protein
VAFDINWGALQTPDIGGAALAGFERGQALTRQMQAQGALKAFLENPGDPRAFSALAAFDPGTAARMGAIQSQRAEAEAKAAERAMRLRLGGMAVDNPQGAADEALRSGEFDIAKQFMGLDDDKQKAAKARIASAAPVAYQALKIKDPAERKAFVLSHRDGLVANGWDPAQIDAFEPTDEALGSIVNMATSLEQARALDKINYESVPEGARLVPFDSFGRPLTDDQGQADPAPPANHGAVGTVLSGAGLPGNVVAGFLGNFEAEGGYGGARGDGGTAAGIAQWRGERQDNFQRVIGKPVGQATPEEQARFVLWEMENPEAAGMTVEQRDSILSARTPGEAATLIDQYYERSSGQHRQRRVAAANRLAAPDPAKVRADAEAAIAAGADEAEVRKRAAEFGVTL